MKRFVAGLLAVVFLASTTSQAFAIKQLSDQFKKVYAGDEASDAFKELVKDAKCNVCHINKESKKKRNVYGKALHEALEEAEFPLKDFKKDAENEKYVAQLKEIFKKVSGEKSGDEEHKTFADRMEADLLPGGDTEGK